MVRSDRMIPNAHVTYYFEALLKNLGKDGYVRRRKESEEGEDKDDKF